MHIHHLDTECSASGHTDKLEVWQNVGLAYLVCFAYLAHLNIIMYWFCLKIKL